MTDGNHIKEHEQELIGSLLESLYNSKAVQAQSLVTVGLNRIRKESNHVGSDDLECSSQRTNVIPGWAAFVLATSALFFFAFVVLNLDSSRNAMAAVVKSLDQAVADNGRHYIIRSKFRVAGRHVLKEADLYVKGGERFAIRASGPLGILGSFWMGSSGEKAWVVPPVGPILEGKKAHLFTWFHEKRDEISTPYLHITTVLERMRDLYDLEFLDDESLQLHDKIVDCQHVIGKLNGESTEQTPEQIELWIDAETGVALKVVANWNLPENNSGRDSVVIEWKREKELDDVFFTSKAHEGDGRRPRISFNKGEKS